MLPIFHQAILRHLTLQFLAKHYKNIRIVKIYDY